MDNYSYDNGAAEREHIPAPHICRYKFAMRAECLCCVGLGVIAEREAYESLAIVLATLMQLMMMSPKWASYEAFWLGDSPLCGIAAAAYAQGAT